MPHMESSYFVCYTPRCGSTLLCDALVKTGVAGYPEEYFPLESLYVSVAAAVGRPLWKQDWGAAPFRACLDTVLRLGTTPNGVFGAKVMPSNLRYLERALRESEASDYHSSPRPLENAFPHLRYIWVVRRDKFRQAISLFKARQSKTWISRSTDGSNAPVLSFNFQMIDECLRSILHREAEWEEHFASSGIVPFTVVYEDLVADYERTVRRVLEYLNVELPVHYQFPPPGLRRQADAVSDEWVRRYRELEGKRMSRQWMANLPRLLRDQSLRDSFAMPGLNTRRSGLARRAARVVRPVRRWTSLKR